MLNEEIESVSAELVKWKDGVGKNSNINYKHLAEKLDCTYSYICRIAKGQRASYSVVSELLKLIRPEDPEAVFAFLKKTYPKECPPVEPDREEKEKSFNAFEGPIVDDPLLYRVYRLSEGGAFTRQDIEMILSTSRAYSAIDYLISNEIVEEVEGKVKRCPKRANTYNFGTLSSVKSFKNNLELIEKKKRRSYIDPEYEFDRDANSLCGLNYSVTPEALEEISENRRKYLKKQHKIMRNSKGDIPIFLNDTLGRYDDK